LDSIARQPDPEVTMNTANSRLSVTRTTLLAAAQLLCTVPLHAATGSWTNNTASGLSWTTATSWAGGIIPNGTGDVANFTNDISANRIISLSGNKTLGTLNIGDSATGFFAFTLNAGAPLNSTLIFDQTGIADATITVPVVAGVAANGLSVPYILLKDNLVISAAFPNSTTTQLNLSGIIRDDDGTFGITKTGSGIIQFAAANTFKGGTTLQAGRINSNNVRAFGTGGVTVQSGGQAFINTASIASDFTIAGTGYTNSADTAAQAGAIRFANNRVITGDVTVAAAARIGGDTTAVGFLDGTLAGSADLEINGPTTTTGGFTLLRDASGYTGSISLSRGSFQFSGGLGGSLGAAPVAAATVTLGTGTSLGGNLTLDSTAAPVTLRNVKGTLAIAGNLSLTGNTPVSLASTPAPGTGTLTLMTYATQSGAGSLTFDSTGYRGTPTIAVGPTAATITGLEGATRTWNNASANGIWDIGTSANWVEGDNRFFQADAVVFSDTAPGTVTLAGIVAPHSVTFSSTGTNDYFITGTGTIDGASGGIIKNGDAWLTLGGENTFTGPVSIHAGRFLLSSQRSLGFTSGVTVATGATLDLNGIATLAASRSYDLTLAGTGDGSSPALTNEGPNISFTGSPASGIRNITLTADASIGAPVGKNFDIGGGGTIDGGGFTLTKTGGNQIILMGLAKNLHTVVEAGTLSGFGPDPFGTTLRIKTGAIAQASASGSYNSDITLDSGATLEHSTGTESIWTGTFTAAGDITLGNLNTSNTNLAITQGFAVPGNLTKTGNGLVTLLGTVDVTGSVGISGGILSLGNGGSGGSLGTTAAINFSGIGPNLTINRSSDLALPNLISGGGSITKSGTGTATLTADNSYSGTTTINAGGTLRINGTQSGTGNVNVASGGTLGGTGTLPGAVNIVSGATLAPGAGIGTFTTGSSTRTTTISGTLKIEYDGAAGTATDLLICGDALTIGAASILDFDATGSPLTAPAYVIASYAGTLTGTFATVTDLPAGYTLVYNYNNGVNSQNIALVSPFATWIATFYPGETDPLIVGPGADPDGDGQSNSMEFVLGGTPNNGSANSKIFPLIADSDDLDSDPELLLTIAIRSGTPAFTGSPSPAATRDGFTATVEGGLNLASFTSVVTPVAPVTTGLPAAPAGYEYRTFSLAGSSGLPSKGFLRVQVTP
jgi:autotransporter-associated beta strand protein